MKKQIKHYSLGVDHETKTKIIDLQSGWNAKIKDM